jgi:hypothetical protein
VSQQADAEKQPWQQDQERAALSKTIRAIAAIGSAGAADALQGERVTPR